MADAPLDPPRLVEGPALRLAGIGGRFTPATTDGIPALWKRFEPLIGQLPGQIGGTTYGLCRHQSADGFDYVAGVEVAEFAPLPGHLVRVTLPARRYLVFTHRGKLAGLPATMQAIFTQGLPAAGQAMAAAPMFERYGADFDAATGAGEVEIWIPVAGT